MLSNSSYIVQNFTKFTLADYLIGLGGISRSFYLMGMIFATAAAKLLYKQALILDLFMWQRPNRKQQAKTIKKSQTNFEHMMEKKISNDLLFDQENMTPRRKAKSQLIKTAEKDGI